MGANGPASCHMRRSGPPRNARTVALDSQVIAFFSLHRRQTATKISVQMIPNRFPILEPGLVTITENAFFSDSRSIACGGAPGRIQTLGLLIRRLRDKRCKLPHRPILAVRLIEGLQE